MIDVVFKKCSCCKEVLEIDNFPCEGRHAWCRPCAAARAREYRKTARHRKVREEYMSRPGVREARRAAERQRKRVRMEWKTPRGRLMNARSLARYRARQHELNGNEAAAQHQWQRAEMITREIERMDRESKRDKVDVLNVARAKRKTI